MGDQKKLRLVSLAIYVGNCYLMNIFDGVFIGNVLREFYLCVPVRLGLENLSEGNTSDQKKLRLVSLAIYD